MSSSKPPWWRAFDRVERKVGRPLEDAAASTRYVDTILRGMKIQRAVGGAVGRVARGAVGRVLHAVDIPTRNDLRRVNRQLTTLTTEMREMRRDQQAFRPAGASRAAGAAATPTTTGEPAADGDTSD